MADLSPDRRQVAQRSHSERYIDPRTDQIDIAVLQQNVDILRRMVREKLWQVRHHVQAREYHRDNDTQSARQGRSCTPRDELCLFSFLDRPLGTLIEIPAGLSGREAVRRSQQQSDAEAIFKLRDHLGDTRLPDAKLLGGDRERAGLHDADEGFHGS
jgi:hypothetical protein